MAILRWRETRPSKNGTASICKLNTAVNYDFWSATLALGLNQNVCKSQPFAGVSHFKTAKKLSGRSTGTGEAVDDPFGSDLRLVSRKVQISRILIREAPLDPTMNGV